MDKVAEQPEVRVIMNPKVYKTVKRIQQLHESKAERRRVKLPFYAKFVKGRKG